ncbi:MAG TPA: ABC transporter substrate-binding protein [Trueperaceae bacterium]|nr:ABC transporter substrate-binding protein [Trueperaceae bacterium]
MTRKRIPVGLVSCSLALLALVATGTALAQSSTALRVAATASVTTWDPSLSFSTEAIYLANIYEPLLWANPSGSAEPFTPALATSWEVAEDGLSWTFHLREGVAFHDGATLNAEAVKRSLDRHREIGGAAFIWAPVDEIVIVDDLTVRFNLSYAAPLDLIASSLYGAWIVSPDALDAVAADETYFEAGIGAGTGPYKLSSYLPDSEVVLTAFDRYWGGWDDAEHFSNVVVSIVSDQVIQEQLLRAGEVDLALSLPPASHEAFAANPAYDVKVETTPFNYVGFLNTLRPPLDDVRVRQAISYAVPYADIIEVGVEGLGTQARGPVPEGIFPYSEEVPQYSYNPERARQLLAEAGLADGFSLRLTYAAENVVERNFAPVFADALADVGIDVSIEPMLFNQQWALSKDDPANAQDIFLLLYWPTYSDAGSDNLWSMFHSSEVPFFNLSYWANEEFDALVDEAIVLAGTDRQAAQDLYVEAMTLLVDEAPGLFFMDVGAWYAVPTYLAGFEYNINYPFATFFYPLHLAQ